VRSFVVGDGYMLMKLRKDEAAELLKAGSYSRFPGTEDDFQFAARLHALFKLFALP